MFSQSEMFIFISLNGKQKISNHLNLMYNICLFLFIVDYLNFFYIIPYINPPDSFNRECQ